jgi:homospermidine synthase
VIDEYKVGTILMSEVDCMKRVSDTKLDDTKIYNTWSVTGFVAEASDKTELVCGKNNSFIQPIIPSNSLSKITMEVYPSLDDYKVLFLNEIGLYTSLNSICPLLNNDKIEFTNYRGRLIHHGEIFEMARYFGKNAPFMSYVYQNSQYIDESIKKFSDNIDDLWLYVNQENTTTVFDNIKDKLVGSDSVGCTIFCGDKKVERIFWCGSILSHTDKCVKPEFTPTIVQVCAGVLAGLSYILEDKNKNMGWVESTDLDTMYMLEKSIPLLGKFMFLEIPIDKFSGPISLKKY